MAVLHLRNTTYSQACSRTRSHPLSKTYAARTSLTRRIVNDLKAKMESGKLQAGDRIPASRQLARELGVARGTVVTAVEILTAEGLLEARVGSGTYVSQDAELYFGPVRFAEGKFIEPRRRLDPADIDKPAPAPFQHLQFKQRPFYLNCCAQGWAKRG